MWQKIGQVSSCVMVFDSAFRPLRDGKLSFAFWLSENNNWQW